MKCLTVFGLMVLAFTTGVWTGRCSSASKAGRRSNVTPKRVRFLSTELQRFENEGGRST